MHRRERGVDLRDAFIHSITQVLAPIEDAGDPIWESLPGPQTMALESEADVVGFGGAAGGGKALTLDTPIITPSGWRTMGDLRVGDLVFDECGMPTRIVAVTDVMYEHQVYAVEFDDGSVIKADADHSWLTFTVADRNSLHRQTDEWRAERRSKRPSRSTGKKPYLEERNRLHPPPTKPPPTGTIYTTAQIAASVRVGKGGRINHSILVCAPLQFQEVLLPIDPYVLGSWLGDGTSSGQGFTVADPESIERIRAAGYTVIKWAGEYAYGIKGLKSPLRRLGLLKNKHVPDLYLHASEWQRRELLAGLMDTDGTCLPSGSCEFYSTNYRLMEGVQELLSSLGIKGVIKTGRAKLYGKDCGAKYRIKFTTAQPVFHLTRKLQRQVTSTRGTQDQRYIVDVRELPTEPVKCITVESPSHLYLAGRNMIPTHNSFLVLGMAFTQHRNSIIFRSHFTDLSSMVEDGNKIQDGRASFVWGNKRRWDTPDGRIVELGAVEHDKDKFKYRGRPHDLIAIDEAAEFKESAFRFLIGWLRTTDPNQRTRVLLTFNPPQSPEGQWIVEYFGAWLDPQHANPAVPGELRWYARIDDKDVEVPADWQGVDKVSGEPILPKSRTFIPARVEDNPFLMATGYARELDSLPEPLRSQLRYGLFTANFEDHPWQTIPTAWILAANERWKTQEKPDLALRALGVDASRGGSDASVIASMFGNWVAPLATYAGKDILDGPILAAKVEEHLSGDAVAFIDMIGIGTSPYDILRLHKARVFGVHFGKGSTAKDKTGKLEFANLRAEVYWRAREMLDPNSDWQIALPPDRELLVDLCAPRYSAEGRKIKIEPKELIKDRIGRSPDKGDAVVMLLWGVLMGAGRRMNMV